jgi:hypothetical protein
VFVKETIVQVNGASCNLSFTDAGVPDEFLCPITREIMKDPVICSGKFISYYSFSSVIPHLNTHFM